MSPAKKKGPLLYSVVPFNKVMPSAKKKGPLLYTVVSFNKVTPSAKKNELPFFFAEGVALLKGTTVYNNGHFSFLKAWPYQKGLLYIIVAIFLC
jgi:hypothetical protein